MLGERHTSEALSYINLLWLLNPKDLITTMYAYVNTWRAFNKRPKTKCVKHAFPTDIDQLKCRPQEYRYPSSLYFYVDIEYHWYVTFLQIYCLWNVDVFRNHLYSRTLSLVLHIQFSKIFWFSCSSSFDIYFCFNSSSTDVPFLEAHLK